MQIIDRDNYIFKLKPFIDKPLIKVITGIRRSGKSYILKQLVSHLKTKGIHEQNIIYIDKELLEFDFIVNYQDLHNQIKSVKPQNTNDRQYVLIDEIQDIEQWERAITSLLNEDKYDIYITGSNAHLLASELATLITGRYVEINLFTLSFLEFIKFRNKIQLNINDEFTEFLKFGGFPVLHKLEYDRDACYQYIGSVYNTIVLKDVVSRYNIRNLQFFDSIVRFVFSNIGHLISAQSIAGYLKSQKLNVGVDTVQAYLGYLTSAYVLHKVNRYDVKGKRNLEILDKYYVGDIGIRNVILGFRENDIAGILENIVFLHLLQQGYKVYVGKYQQFEIDFIAERANDKIYVQVCYLLSLPETIEREFSVLKKIKDNHPKYVVSMDNLPQSNTDGIIRMNIIDFVRNGLG